MLTNMEDKTSSFFAAKLPAQAQMLSNRLQKRFRHLKKWAHRTGVGIFRLYDKDIPEIPLVLDFYGDCTQPQECAISGALYKRPYEKDADDEEKWLNAMKDSIAASLGVPLNNIFLKQRQRQKGISQYEKINEARFEKIVSEGGLLANKLCFKVNLSDYLDTGLFADRRLLRAIVREESLNKKVLNLFSYTGAFSVYAAAGGAASTDSVDLSNTYLNWARENFSLNGFSAELIRKNLTTEDTEFTEGRSVSCRYQHLLIREDVLEFVRKAIIKKKLWDIIVVDPPAFSNSKKMTDNFDLNRDLTGLLLKCLPLLSAGGKIFLSVNLQRLAPDAAKLQTELEVKYAVRVTDLESRIVDEDFRGRKVPRAFVICFSP